MHTHFEPRAVVPCAKRRRTGSAALGWLALMVGCLAPGLHAAPTLYPQADPTPQEQYLLQQLNRARMDPAAEGQRLAAWLRSDSFGQSIVAQYAIKPAQVITDFAALPAVPPLTFDAHLLASARTHAAEIAAHGGVGPGGSLHAGYDGSTPQSRELAAGYTQGFGGENAAAAYPAFPSLDELHAGYLVDWGVPDLSHRHISMDGSLGQSVVGIGLATGGPAQVEIEDYGTPALTAGNVVDASADTPAMLTGVVYHDTNANGQYDPGEGVAGARVSMDGGSFYALTSASGGYALPLVRADGSNVDGSVSVSVQFADGSSVSQTVSVGRRQTAYVSYRANVEWDVETSLTRSLAPFFDGSNPLGENWNYLSFAANGNAFGYYNTNLYPYLYHNDLGWEYVLDAQDGRQGVYLYDFQSGDWWYTSPGFGFPYLYDFARKAILYYYPADGRPGYYSSQPRWFYDFAAKKVISL